MPQSAETMRTILINYNTGTWHISLRWRHNGHDSVIMGTIASSCFGFCVPGTYSIFCSSAYYEPFLYTWDQKRHIVFANTCSMVFIMVLTEYPFQSFPMSIMNIHPAWVGTLSMVPGATWALPLTGNTYTGYRRVALTSSQYIIWFVPHQVLHHGRVL